MGHPLNDTGHVSGPCIFQKEPEQKRFATLIGEAPRCVISTVSVLEASSVLESRQGPDAGYDLDSFLRGASIEVVASDDEQLAFARRAFQRYGKGRHPAGLNFGDCAAYALAQWSGEPLLFKGHDYFAATDVARVI